MGSIPCSVADGMLAEFDPSADGACDEIVDVMGEDAVRKEVLMIAMPCCGCAGIVCIDPPEVTCPPETTTTTRTTETEAKETTTTHHHDHHHNGTTTKADGDVDHAAGGAAGMVAVTMVVIAMAGSFSE